MAIDAMGRPTTTGMMDSKPKVPKAPNLSNLKPAKQTKKNMPQQAQPVMQAKAPTTQEEKILSKFPGLKNLTVEDNAVLDTVLSPSVKTAIVKIAPELKEIINSFGTNEPNVVIPLSMATKYASAKYGGEGQEAIQNFTNDLLALNDLDIEQMQNQMEQQTTVPPSQGLMTSPQTT